MQKYNVRPVPWVRIGKHELSGSQTLETLQQRVQWALDDQNSIDKETVNTEAGKDETDTEIKEIIKDSLEELTDV